MIIFYNFFKFYFFISIVYFHSPLLSSRLLSFPYHFSSFLFSTHYLLQVIRFFSSPIIFSTVLLFIFSSSSLPLLFSSLFFSFLSASSYRHLLFSEWGHPLRLRYTQSRPFRGERDWERREGDAEKEEKGEERREGRDRERKIK